MCRHRPTLHSNHGDGTAYRGKETPERRAAAARPGMSAHMASQKDASPAAYRRGTEPGSQAPPGPCLMGSAPFPGHRQLAA
jgi:hypothetical protein